MPAAEAVAVNRSPKEMLRRSKMKRKLIIALAASVLTIALLPQVAHAEEKVCRGSIGARTLDNVKVPRGATCTLRGTKVKGTIKVNNNARLEAIDVNVVGNVQGEGPAT
jgi:hypothetical protein